MDANTSFSIVFFPRTSKLDKNGLARIYLRITVDGRRTEISVKRKIAPDQWCAISNRAKTKGFNQVNKQLNRYLDEIKARIYGIQSEYVTEGRPYTATTIKDKFLNRDKPVKTLLQIYDDHNSEIEQLVGSSYSYGGFRRHVRTRNHLADYLLKRYGQADIFVCEIDLLFINRFHHYLKIQKIGNQNTVTKYVTNFKKIMRIAFANNWVDKDPFFHWQANWKKVEREVLTEVDLLSIIEKELP
ncbi:MAG TPA: phage integrase SAM-like domain and Arm DNA-binding domain-containing protein, partial [Pricia sp.]|nr:phage integrase SAM-like domain and Arm DNA-binding domain-containing protein [Pricia sp.]